MIEPINTRVDVPAYLLDGTTLALECIANANRANLRLQYDVYHMQIMEGDIIRTITRHMRWIGHFHTAGNPGRQDMDDAQELNYRGICVAIAASTYDLYVGHEFRPKGDTFAALGQTFALCDV